MLYLVEILSEAYEKIKDNFENEKLIIYGIPFDDESIKIDIEKTIEDLKYIYLSDKGFYLLELKPKKLRKLTELSLEEWKNIFYYFGAENEYSIYSDTLLKEDYKKIISKIQEKYSSEEKKKFFERYILTLGLISIMKNDCDKKELGFIIETLKNMGFNKKFLKDSIGDFLCELSKNVNLDVSNLVPLVKKVFTLSSGEFVDSELDPVLAGYYSKIKEDIPLFILSLLREEYLFSFISLFNFLVKPLENISFEDIKTLIKNYKRIEIENLRENLKEQYRLINNKNTTADDIEFEEKLFSFMKMDKMFSIHMQLYLERIKYRFKLLKICLIEKIYKYLLLNPNEDKNLENELTSEKLRYNDLVKDIKKHIIIKKEKINLKDYWGTYLKYYEELPFRVEKKFYFNDFFRMQLFYRKEIFENLTFLTSSIEGNIYEKLDTIKGNFKKLKYSQREIGQDNYDRIISLYEDIISSLEKNENKTSLEIELFKSFKINKINFILMYMLLQRYKSIYDIKINLEDSNDKMAFIKYNNYINLGDIYDFKINRNSYKDDVDVLDMCVTKFFYQREELDYYNLNMDKYYVVELIDNSKGIFLLQYVGKFSDKLLFRNNFEIKSYLPEEIKIRKIKYLEFLEQKENDKKSLL